MKPINGRGTLIETEDVMAIFYERTQVTVDDLLAEFQVPRRYLLTKLRNMQFNKKIHVVAPKSSNDFIRTVWALGEKEPDEDCEPVVQVTTKHWKTEPFQVTMLEQLLFAKPLPSGVQLCLI